MRKLSALGTLAVLAVAGIGSAALTAQAVEKESLAKPNQFYGAIVNANGTLVDNVGVSGATRTAVGRYTVRFKKDVASCYPAVSIYGLTSGAIRSQRDGSDPKEINVFTRSEGTASTSPGFFDRSFSIVVICK